MDIYSWSVKRNVPFLLYYYSEPFQAHENLAEMEMIKDEVLVEINKSANPNSADRDLCKQFFLGVEEVGKKLEDQLGKNSYIFRIL